MAKWQNDSMLNAAHQWIIDNCDHMYLVDNSVSASSLGSYTHILAHDIADHAMTSADFALAAGDTSGRKVTIAEQVGITMAAGGTIIQNVLTGSISSTQTVLYATDTSALSVSASDLVTVPAWDIELQDAV